MSKLFFGKLSTTFPRQFEGDFYAAGKKGSSWYGGMNVGDYVFPIYNSFISKLWKVKEYSSEPTSENPEGSILFEVVTNFKEPFPIASVFTRYKYFNLDLNMLNKSMKQTASQKIGFFEISCTSECPSPDKIDLSMSRNIYISVDKPFSEIEFEDNDIRILVDNKESLKIKDIQIYNSGAFNTYSILNDLYNQRNKVDERYSLKELYDFAITDQATRKEKFLNAAIQEIEKNGVFTVANPIVLYDNVIVGRKVTQKAKGDQTESTQDEESELSVDEFDEYSEFTDLLKFSPNLVLYGPPGTGKTYSARKIVEAFEFKRTKRVRTFNEIEEEGRISFVTFHQSFSYEEFIEGLRPVINNSEEKSQNDVGENLKYKVQPGVLLKLANNAARSQINKELISTKGNDLLKENARIWKISLGQKGTTDYTEVFESCIEKGKESIAIGWFDEEDIGSWDYDKIYNELLSERGAEEANPTNNASSINNFIREVEEGDIVLVFGSQTTIRAIGIVNGPYEYWKDYTGGEYPHRRRMKWLKIFDTQVDITKYNSGKVLSQVTLYEMRNIDFLKLKDLLEDEPDIKTKDKVEIEPYFLIIDEINRGNISKIFGELITLVEKDKRDKVKVTLPYSQNKFSLPSNIFIIGTMNTADRSIAVLDIALRRRFNFKEIEPDAAIIRNLNQIIDGNLDLAILFEKLNSKILEKLDSDHRIGHSYFLNIFSLSDLRIAWYHQIIPLIMEYFYNDTNSIAGIISNEFIDVNTSKIKWIKTDQDFKNALLKI